MRAQAQSKSTTDHEQIREWVESRGGHPACVRGTGKKGDTGLLRIDYPGYSGKETLQEISWDEFFNKFDERHLAFVYQDKPNSRFSKLVEADNVKSAGAAGAKRSAATHRDGTSRTNARASVSTTARKTAGRTAAAKTTPARKTATGKSFKTANGTERASSKTAPKRSASAKTQATRTSATKKQAATKASGRTSRSAKTTIDHEQIKEWVEHRGGNPACVRGTGGKGDPGMIRIDYPGFSGERKLMPISWDEWFDSFDKNNLAFLYQDTPRSRFSKLVERGNEEQKARKPAKKKQARR